MLASQGVGLVATAIILAGAAEPVPPSPALLWAVLAGLSGIGGLACFYIALSRGTMGLIAPLAGLIGAALPALVAMLAGESVGGVRLAGMAAALVAVVLISLPERGASSSERRAARLDLRELPLVGLSGLGFAGFFLFLDRSTTEGAETWWPLVVVRLVGVLAILGFLVLAAARPSATPRRQRVAELLAVRRFRAMSRRAALAMLPLLGLAGAGDLGGNAFFLLANREDAFQIAVVLSSLYPIVTALLAVIFLHERLRGVQVMGVVLAVFGVALIGLGGAAGPMGG